MKILWNMLLVLGMITALYGCVIPYDPPILSQPANYLVVEGTISSGSSTQIRLSRTTGLTDSSYIKWERNAIVSIEGQKGFSAQLQAGQGGDYFAPPLDLDPDDLYRLRIITANGKQYLSDYVPIKQTPAVDSISWEKKPNGVQLYVNTHDPNNNTRYYKWDYRETWEYNVPFESMLDYVDGQFVARDQELPRFCWQYNNSTSILVGTSAKLANDIVTKQPIAIVPNASVKLSSRYSILVRQQALSKEAFEYYQQMKKNTEQTGSFFDPQPAEVSGNIRNVDNPNEPVIGYISAGTVEEKRIFIRNQEIQPWAYNMDCSVMEVEQQDFARYFGGNYEPLYTNASGDIAYGTLRRCADCSYSASPQKPDYWD